MEKQKRLHIRKIVKSLLLVLLSVCIGLGTIVSCEGPAGEQGPQGPEGPEGPVGPAGEDGSMMYSGQGAPTSDIGNEGDYYINTSTGELYGPKDADGWGNAIMVLMGQDGQDGEDGSQIYAGIGAPASSKGVVGDYYLDKSNYDLYGPKTDNGWGSPINLKGADGNANVTRYIFPGYDYTNNWDHVINVTNIETVQDYEQSAWLVYLVKQDPNLNTPNYWSIPGYGLDADVYYTVKRYYLENTRIAGFRIDKKNTSNTGHSYDRIEVVRIEASNTVDYRKSKSDSIIPDDLDITNYQEVANYYGFGENN